MIKLIDKFGQFKNPLLIFEHGLGDFVNFLPVYYELRKQTNKIITLASSEKRQFHLIDRNVISITNNDTNNLRRIHDFVYRVSYPDSKNSEPPIELHNEAAKPYLCAFYEFGMKDFTWKPYRMFNKWEVKDSKRIGIHLFGHTGMNKKFCPKDVAQYIWNEIIEAGYEPYEVHMIPQFSKDYSLVDRGADCSLPMINKYNSLRFEEPDLQRMIEETGKCKYFIGIDSGPIYLASVLLGCENIIGITNKKRHDHFLPRHISTINVGMYKKGIIKQLIKQKENYHENVS